MLFFGNHSIHYIAVQSFQMEPNYALHGIRMNCICPTRVDTKFIDQVQPGRVYHAEDHIADKDQTTGALT